MANRSPHARDINEDRTENMSVYRPTPIPAIRHTATMRAFSATSASPAVAPATQAPNAPSAPSLAQSSVGALVVTWAAPAIDLTHNAATAFNLWWSPSGANNWTTVTGVSSPYTLTGLATGVAIDVQIQSANAAGKSGWSATTTITTATVAPNAPAAAILTQGPGSSAITVIWLNPATDSAHGIATGFNLRSSPSGAGTWTTVSAVTSPYIISGLTAGAALDVQVQSTNAAGNSAWSATSTIAAATGGPNAPAAPTVVKGTGTNLTVTWTAPTIDSTHNAATTFNLRSSPSGTNIWTVVSGVTSPYTLSGLAPNAAIDVQVQGANAAGTSVWSATTTLTTAVGAPNTPTAPSLAQGTGSNLTVTWTTPATDSTHGAATSFNLRSSPSGANTWTTVSSVASPYTLSGLAGTAAIDVQIEGVNATGTSTWSATSTLTTGVAGTYAPNAPAITSVAPPPDGTASKLAITWTAPTTDSTHGAATAYNLRYSPTGAGTWTTVSGVTSPYTLTGLTGAAAIDVEVQAANAATSPGPWSAITTGTTWGVTVAPGGWVAAATQVHGTSVVPNGGLQLTATAAPTAVTGAVFAWSPSNTVVPTASFIVAANLAGAGQPNGWGVYCNAPAAAGTFYLWMLAQATGSVTAGALVTSAITVT
jgi:Fibronectin type III domain